MVAIVVFATANYRSQFAHYSIHQIDTLHDLILPLAADYITTSAPATPPPSTTTTAPPAPRNAELLRVVFTVN